MKSLLSKVVVLVLSASLVTACSQYSQSTNTGIGAGSGAILGGLAGSAIGAGTGQVVAIGAGAIAGALLGGYIGKNMDSSDKHTMNNAMENNKPNQSTSWKNSQTGARYKVKPTSTMMSYHGYNNCRKYHTTGYMDGKRSHVDGIACRQKNGSWQPVSAT